MAVLGKSETLEQPRGCYRFAEKETLHATYLGREVPKQSRQGGIATLSLLENTRMTVGEKLFVRVMA